MSKKVAQAKKSSEKVQDPIVKIIELRKPKRGLPEVVEGGVRTIIDGKERYDDKELEEFRVIIIAKLEEARRDYDLLKRSINGEDNNGDPHKGWGSMAEDGAETSSREETTQLAARQEKFIKHLGDAMLRIHNKTYGICRATGRLISKDRLRLVPHATLSVEAKKEMPSGQPNSRANAGGPMAKTQM